MADTTERLCQLEQKLVEGVAAAKEIRQILRNDADKRKRHDLYCTINLNAAACVREMEVLVVQLNELISPVIQGLAVTLLAKVNRALQHAGDVREARFATLAPQVRNFISYFENRCK
jgi:ketopantoate hydroxymethyltransferase